MLQHVWEVQAAAGAISKQGLLASSAVARLAGMRRVKIWLGLPSAVFGTQRQIL